MIDHLSSDTPDFSTTVRAQCDHDGALVRVTVPSHLIRSVELDALSGEEAPLSGPPDLALWVVHWIVMEAGAVVHTARDGRESHISIRLSPMDVEPI